MRKDTIWIYINIPLDGLQVKRILDTPHRAVEKELNNYTLKVNDYMKWKVVEEDEKASSWIRTQQAMLYKVKDKRKFCWCCFLTLPDNS